MPGIVAASTAETNRHQNKVAQTLAFRTYVVRHLQDSAHLETVSEGSCPYVQRLGLPCTSEPLIASGGDNSSKCARGPVHYIRLFGSGLRKLCLH